MAWAGVDRLLWCPRCAWVRTAEVLLQRDGFHCRNCQQFVRVEDLDVVHVGRGAHLDDGLQPAP